MGKNKKTNFKTIKKLNNGKKVKGFENLTKKISVLDFGVSIFNKSKLPPIGENVTQFSLSDAKENIKKLKSGFYSIDGTDYRFEISNEENLIFIPSVYKFEAASFLIKEDKQLFNDFSEKKQPNNKEVEKNIIEKVRESTYQGYENVVEFLSEYKGKRKGSELRTILEKEFSEYTFDIIAIDVDPSYKGGDKTYTYDKNFENILAVDSIELIVLNDAKAGRNVCFDMENEHYAIEFDWYFGLVDYCTKKNGLGIAEYYPIF